MNRRNIGRGGFRREGSGVTRTFRAPDPSEHDREAARNRAAGGGLDWKKIDLHLHTPASSDYRDPGVSYLDILKKAEEKGLDMIAFTDHNTVSGFAAMQREIETLSLLERLGRLTDVERSTLDEYRRLMKKIVVLPGFEFTATFGFHILGIFPENTSIRKLEYLLLNLNVPEEKMLAGAPDVGSTSDVLSAYSAITGAGGLAIAAHANSSNGVAMQGFPFGGQTKIAYTQDTNLAALEVTDLEVTGRRTTASFYNGTKPEYPRRMHIIQGSDAHALNTEQIEGNKRLGVGARITEVLVKDASFAALKELLTSSDFTRTRPYRAGAGWESVEQARREGSNMTQSFHERAINRTNRTRPILFDIVAFSNAGGGTIYVGASSEASVPIGGIERPEDAARMIKEDMRRTIEPPVEPEFTTRGSAERGVLVITVPAGTDAPYAFTPTGQVYIRVEGESVVANRDEIVTLVLDAARNGMARVSGQAPVVPSRPAQPQPPAEVVEALPPATATGRAVPVPASPAPTSPTAPSGRQGREERQEERREPRPGREDRKPQGRENRRDRTAQAAPTTALPAAPQPTPQPEQPRAQETRAAEQPAPAAPVQAPRPTQPERNLRIPDLSSLPPEKLKGQVRPMAPRTGSGAPAADADVAASADTLEMPPVIAAEAIEAAEPIVLPATPGEGLELVPDAEDKGDGRRGRSRRRGGRAGETVKAPAAELAAEVEVEAPQPVEVAPEPDKKPSRGRSRRKAAEQPAADTSVQEIETPTEATVSAEHLSREEIVAEEPEKPARGRSRRRDKKMEVDAPTAAAMATDAGAEAILVQAEVEPGAQIPGELSPEQLEPEMTSPPAKKGRSRRKTAAQQAALVEVEEVPASEAAPAEPAEEAAPKKSRSRSRKKPDATGTEAQPPTGEAPDPPSTGVEIISTEERNGNRFHTMRDLRNSTTVHNVTRQSARRLWLYAIMQHEHGDPALAEVAWHPNLPIGVWRREHRAGEVRYDLVTRYPDGSLRIFYGVTEDGLRGPWGELVQFAQEADYSGPPAIEK